MSISSVKLGTFNVENLFLRYKFNRYDRERIAQKTEFLSLEEERKFFDQLLSFDASQFDLIRGPQRANTAKVILENKPAILAVQEVENLQALKQFNEKLLGNYYQYQMIIDGNDVRGIDVGILSQFPIVHVRSYQFDKDSHNSLIFSRDCLEVDILLPNSRIFSLFVNHFKSKIGGGEEKRRKQAQRVAEILQGRFGQEIEASDFVVMGDLNANPNEIELKPLLTLDGIENVVQSRLPVAERWTHYYLPKNEGSQLDYLLLSSSLARKNPTCSPYIERRGLGDYVKIYEGPRFPGIGPEGTEASDHCPIFMELEI